MDEAAFCEWFRTIVDQYELKPAAAADMLQRIRTELKKLKRKSPSDTAAENLPGE